MDKTFEQLATEFSQDNIDLKRGYKAGFIVARLFLTDLIYRDPTILQDQERFLIAIATLGDE